MKLIVGLGNPGKPYENTRHNVGFLVIDALLEWDQNALKEGKGLFRINRNPFQGGIAVVAKPNVFMNESGRAVATLLEQFHISRAQCLVVADDVNLPIGTIRFRASGSAGGHHGLESILEAIGTGDFPRLRIGIGTPASSRRDLTDHVLGVFSKSERELLVSEIERARDACLEWLRSDAETVMRLYN